MVCTTGEKRNPLSGIRIQWNKVLTVVLVDQVRRGQDQLRIIRVLSRVVNGQVFWPLVMGFGLSVGTVWFSSFQAWRRRA